MGAIEKALFGFIDKAVEKAKKRTLPSHLEDDGLLYCDICGVPIQCRQEILGKEMILPCICKCEKAENDRKKEEERQAEIANNIIRLRAACFDSAEMRKWRFDADDGKQEETSKISKNFVKNFDKLNADGRGLLFFGDVGTGKTFQAACIANGLIDLNLSVRMTTIARIVNDLQGSLSGRNEYIDKLCRYELLILDDLDAERNTEFVNEVIFEVVDGRYQSGKPLIVTTNLTRKEMLMAQDKNKKRIYSRILERCYPVNVSGIDRRKASLASDFAEMKKLLEG